MSYLYKSASGREVSHLSYSAISDYDYCPELFRLSRIEGWKDKGKKAAFEFGNCVEAGIQFYHANGLNPGDGIDEFKRLWLKWKDISLIFTEKEGNWFDLLGMGADLLRLYEIFLPALPIRNAKFQLNYKKALWPGSDLAHLEFTSFIDLLSTRENGERILVDIKTSGVPLDPTPNILSLDPQLKDYAWATGIKKVAFLWLIKGKPSFRKGDQITLLEDTGKGKAGDLLTIGQFQSPKLAVEASEGVKAKPAVEWLMLVGDEKSVRLMDKALDKVSGKGAAEKEKKIIAAFVAGRKLYPVQKEQITKVRLQWAEATIPDKDIPEAGQLIGHKMIQIKTSVETNFFPKTGGVRFPNNKCTFCRMRGLCLGRKDLVDQLLVKIGPTVKEEDWLSELEGDVE